MILGYIAMRLVQLIPMALVVTMVVFFVMMIVPGDPVMVMLGAVDGAQISKEVYDAMHARLGLDQPLIVQYLHWLASLLQGDLGTSISYRTPALEVILQRLVPTLYLMIGGLIVAILFAVPAGVLAAIRAEVGKGGEILADVKRRATSLSPEDRTPLEDAIVLTVDGRALAVATDPLPDGATLMRVLNVTDSREREKELKERNAFLEDIDRQKSKFVDHVSYQLRTPLNTILGFAEMLEDPMFGVLNDRQKDYLASILTAANHLKDLINDVIDLAVIDAGKMALETGDVDIRELLENAATYAALKAEDTQVTLSVDCARDIGRVVADEKRLKQVLFNLLSNAFAYTGAGGRVELGADRSPGLLRIWVADTGRGVSPEDQAKAFDPFESRGPSAGAGIGLSLVQRFIGLHGGWVRLQSRPGEGTCVTCYLPIRAEPLEAAPPPALSAGSAMTMGKPLLSRAMAMAVSW